MRSTSKRALLSAPGVAGASFVFVCIGVLSAGGCSSANPREGSSPAATVQQAATGFPQYDHVFLIINENHNYTQIIGNPAAPIINALASDYGVATSYTGVSDPSEPNYVAMLGGSDFGINSDDPYFFPGHTVNAPNLMSQLESGGKTWKGYFQDMPYPGYRGYCYPAKCNGIPDSDTQYVAKHNGILNFVNMQTPAEFAKMTPYPQLAADLASGNVPNLSYIVGDECHDMHGAPPWCVDSGKSGDVDDTWLVATGDKFVGDTVNAITSSSLWATGNNAIVVTFDEGNVQNDKVVTVVAANHGPRGIKDNTSYDHYSLLASLEQTFGGLPCIQNSCSANTMAPLFQVTGSTGVPTLPAPFIPPADGTDTVTPGGASVKGKAFKLPTSGWTIVPTPSIGSGDNNLTGVSAGSATDVWAIGSYIPTTAGILQAMGEHYDGSSWTEFPLPNVGPNENSLLGVSELASGHAWAVGYFVSAEFKQQTLVEHFDGTSWTVVPSPNPGALQNILYGVAAISDSDVWAVGAMQDANALWHTLAEHWNGSAWTVVPTVDAGTSGNQFFAVTAVSSTNVYATGQQSGTGFPNNSLVEQWNGTAWSLVSTPTDPGGSEVPLGATATSASVSIVGDRESSTAPYTTFVAAGAPKSIGILSTPNNGSGENDLFAATTAPDGSTWAVGWYIVSSSLTHQTLIEQGVSGTWSIISTPNTGTGDNGLAGITAVPGGGMWAVGVSSSKGNFSTLIMYHP
jgi:phosphoesterase family protein